MFCNVYVDESSQTKHRFLVIGSLIVPHSHVEQFEADITAARDHTIPVISRDGKPKVIKWEKVNAFNVEGYKKVVDAYWIFPQRHNLPMGKHVDINCVVVDTSKKPLKAAGDGSIEIGFNKQVYFLCVALVGKRFKKELFHIYPDRRTSPQPLSLAQRIMNMGARKYGDKREYPFRRLRYQDPEGCQALQVVDIFIGALAYRLNGHADKPNANKAKKELSDYILKRAKIINAFATTPIYQRRFTVVHRPDQRATK